MKNNDAFNATVLYDVINTLYDERITHTEVFQELHKVACRLTDKYVNEMEDARQNEYYNQAKESLYRSLSMLD